tara:strand:- start:71 stop:658 length:588 start_codon:yes stop_codon:yes gene_type:complete
MFKQHQPIIEKYARQNPDNLEKVLVFVLTTIQKRLSTCVAQRKQINILGVNAVCLNGRKQRTYKEIVATKAYLYDKIFSDDISNAEKLLEITSIYGIGTVKAGFIMQLCLGEIGCLDVHNLKRFGLSPNVFKVSDKMPQSTAIRKANFYIKTCEDLGGCEYLWDSWCQYLAEIYPNIYTDANDVSDLHVNCIIKQ